MVKVSNVPITGQGGVPQFSYLMGDREAIMGVLYENFPDTTEQSLANKSSSVAYLLLPSDNHCQSAITEEDAVEQISYLVGDGKAIMGVCPSPCSVCYRRLVGFF